MIDRKHLESGISVVGGIFLFKSLSLAPTIGDFLSNNWLWVATLSLIVILSPHIIAGVFYR